MSAGGSAPLAYQWWFNGTNLLADAADASLAISNAMPANGGFYSVSVSNVAGSVTSVVASLTVLVPPAIITQPSNAIGTLGTSAVFAVVAEGTGPLAYQWFFNQTNLLTWAVAPTMTLTNLQATDAGAYQVTVSNIAGMATSVVATLTIPNADRDGDGMPDAWEIDHSFDPHNPADAALDADGDGLTNLQEYLAGTNPRDASSKLSVEFVSYPANPGEPVVISFPAVAGNSYSVLYRAALDAGNWLVLTNVPALPTSQQVVIQDTTATGQVQRFYRIVTPSQP